MERGGGLASHCQSACNVPRRKAQRCHTRMRGAGARRVACSARGPFSQGVPPATSVLHVLPLLGGYLSSRPGRKGQSLRSIDSLREAAAILAHRSQGFL